jgi:hypothetical protein
MLADNIAPPGVVAELASAKLECGIEVKGNPAGFMTPVLEQRLTRLEQLFTEGGIEPVEPAVSSWR